MNNFDIERERVEQTNRDWKFGAESKPSIVFIPETERDIYLPIGETQFNGFADFNDCASRSPTNHLEALFTYHYLHAMKPENKKWMEDQGYVFEKKVTFSDRFTAVLSGTTHSGNSLKAPIDSIYRNGLIPKKLLPKTETMTWEEYYSPIPQNLKDLGLEFLKRFTVNYEQVFLNQFAEVLEKDMIGVAAYAWANPVNGVYPKSTLTPNHAFLLYKLPKWEAFDNYLDWNKADTEKVPGDFTKTLASDYIFFDYGYRVFLSSEQVPSPLSDLPPAQSVSLFSWLAKMIAWLFKKDGPMPSIPPEILPDPKPTTPKPSRIADWAKAIEGEEGGKPTDLNMRLNNPGNLKYTQYTQSLGGEETPFLIEQFGGMHGPQGSDGGYFCKFLTYEDGFRALCQFLKDACNDELKAYRGSDTLAKFTQTYANPPSLHPYASNVAKKLGVFPSIKIRDLL